MGTGEIIVQSYTFNHGSDFVISDFQKTKTFSSFLPGIAGLHGMPLWAFYVNRGQGIASFGIRDKDGAILEFLPANKSYQLTPTQGFRTFIKLRHNQQVWEPFATGDIADETMILSPNSFTLESHHKAFGLRVIVTYFIMPNQPFAALVRRVTIVNTGREPVDLEVIDGLPQLLPYGLDNAGYKAMGNTLRSWMDVEHVDEGIPYYRLRASTADVEEVSAIEGGHFFLSFTDKDGVVTRNRPLVDPDLVFQHDTTLLQPIGFSNMPLAELLAAPQMTTNRVPCGFATTSGQLTNGQQLDLVSLYGYVRDFATIAFAADHLCSLAFIERKLQEAESTTRKLTHAVHTTTSHPVFDAYCEMSYLDNILRGGWPITFAANGSGRTAVFHAYSRKHGDLERDYNAFSITPTYYSQGNGNYRDVNQNRRMDVLFNPNVGTWNIETFVNLIQTDGYNPLVVKGATFVLRDVEPLLDAAEVAHHEALRHFFANPFDPGSLLHFLEDAGINLHEPSDIFLSRALSAAEQRVEAEFGEGYWIDHWTYVLDLVLNYLTVFPDKKVELLLGERKYQFYDSPGVVQPRQHKYVLKDGVVGQRRAVVKSDAKKALIQSRDGDQNWMRTQGGYGPVFITTLYAKLVTLATIKFASLDPDGVGIEMEANKPGWNDSMNGLPGLFGSGVGELYELIRLLEWLYECRHELAGRSVMLPIEVMQLLTHVHARLLHHFDAGDTDRFLYWDAVATLREDYRLSTTFGFDGSEESATIELVSVILQDFIKKLRDSMARIKRECGDIYPTYFCYQVTDWVAWTDDAGMPQTTSEGQPLVRPTAFHRLSLPRFLEGPARAMKVISQCEARDLHEKVIQSPLYDSSLRMFKSSESLLSQPFSIGRARAFTPGWLENESVFMHVEYKYLLELLRSGLYDTFFNHAQTALVPFLNPQTYGRSPLEHSSFIASSANPDPTVHGRGFVARLSGSTVEFLQMWTILMFGGQPFGLHQGQLVLTMRPVLPGWLFDDQGHVSFMFLGTCDVTYINTSRRDTFGPDAASVSSYEIHWRDGDITKIDGAVVSSVDAARVRTGLAASMIVSLR